MNDDLFDFINHLTFSGIHLISFHIGESTCFVIKNSSITTLTQLTNEYDNNIFVDVLSSISDGYQYLFIKNFN